MWSDGRCGTGSLEEHEISGAGVIETRPASPLRQTGRLVAWSVLVGVLAVISYAGRLAGAEPPDDVLYLWSTFVGALVQYTIMLVLVLAIARGLDRAPPRARGPGAAPAGGGSGRHRARRDRRDRRRAEPVPRRRRRAGPRAAGMGFLAGRRRSSQMRSSSALVAPFVEELLFRGLGYGLLRQFVGPWPAILVTGSRLRARPRPRPRPARPHHLRDHPRLAPLADGERLPGDGRPRPLQRSGARRGGDDVTERFDEIRGEIAANDAAIVAAVNRRLELVAELWALKARARPRDRGPGARAAPARAARGLERRPAVGRRARSARDRAARPDEARTAAS